MLKLKPLAEKLGLTATEVQEKLGLADDASPSDIGKALGGVAFYATEKDLEKKLAENAKTAKTELATANTNLAAKTTELDSMQANLKAVVQAVAKQIGITQDIDITDSSLGIDYGNLTTSLRAVAQNRQWAIPLDDASKKLADDGKTQLENMQPKPDEGKQIYDQMVAGQL